MTVGINNNIIDNANIHIDDPSSQQNVHRTVTILQRSSHHIVALKPPGVVCHHSGWTGSRSKSKRGEEPEIPMLQRVRDALHDIELKSQSNDDISTSSNFNVMRRVNLIHRLDRGASGALLLTYAECDDEDDEKEEEEKKDGSDTDDEKDQKGRPASTSTTAQLINAMQSPDSIKTYVALVRGEGILCGEDLTKKGWFEVDRPIKDDNGELKEASTYFHFVAGQAESGLDRPRICLVLARPKQGRWHQIRRHLNGLSHPIIGDSTHGVSKVNREWRVERNMPGERIALHLGRIQLVPTENFPEGIDVSAPLLEDMLDMLRVYAPDVLERSLPTLEKEGILVDITDEPQYEVGRWTIPDVLLQPKLVLDDDGDVDILEEGKHYVVASKPPVVVVHHSSWTSSTQTDPNLRWKENIPMLQRVRAKTGRRVNLVHRLDRGASGCLLFSFAEDNNMVHEDGKGGSSCKVTKSLIGSMQHPNATKTYIALCDGVGTWNGVNYLEKGWFTFRNPVKDEQGNLIEDAETDIRFIASAILPPIDNMANETTSAIGDDNMEGRKVSIILARPQSGRWHQIRQHLASGTIGHAILGDSTHGRSRTNRIWKKKRHLLKERVCLHLARIQLPPTDYSLEGIGVTCPLPPDLMKVLGALPTELLDAASPILAETGILI